jgi:hypothetical protein
MPDAVQLLAGGEGGGVKLQQVMRGISATGVCIALVTGVSCWSQCVQCGCARSPALPSVGCNCVHLEIL